MACGVWICHRVGHVRRCAMLENLLFFLFEKINVTKVVISDPKEFEI